MPEGSQSEACANARTAEKPWFHRHKPAARARWHLLLASSLWTVVGSALLYFGVGWVLERHGRYTWLLLAVAAAAGLLKARFVLSKTADRTVKRIEVRGDANCLGGFLSLGTWGFVVSMMVLGRLLRGGVLPHAAVGVIYVAVGLALLVASTWLWRAWYRHRTDT